MRLRGSGYFAGVTDRASAAGNLAAGYNEVYLTLAGMAVAGAVVAAVLRPISEPKT